MVNHLYFIFLVFESIASLDYVFFFFFFIRRPLIWTEQHDTLFLREILHIQHWIHRHGSQERGQAWDEIAAILNSLVEGLFLKVTPRSVRDRYSLLVNKYKSKWRAEDKSSGTAPSYTEIDEALYDLIERLDEADAARQKATAEKKSKVEEKLAQAQNMQNASLETFGETRKSKENDTGEGSQERSRKPTSKDFISYFSEKHEREISLRQEELKLKKQELDLQAQQMQQAQHIQQAQFLLIQQQSSVILEILKSMNQKQ